jgi:hypothetical protein
MENIYNLCGITSEQLLYLINISNINTDTEKDLNAIFIKGFDSDIIRRLYDNSVLMNTCISTEIPRIYLDKIKKPEEYKNNAHAVYEYICIHIQNLINELIYNINIHQHYKFLDDFLPMMIKYLKIISNLDIYILDNIYNNIQLHQQQQNNIN